jgi:hypothetical protein
MSEYDFGISYIKGKQNVVADALSRRPCVFSLVPLKVDLREHVLKQLLGDSWYLRLLQTSRVGGNYIQSMKDIAWKQMDY